MEMTAVLMGNSSMDGLVVASVYNQKPFYMTTNVAWEIKWNEDTKKVWSKVKHAIPTFNFFASASLMITTRK